MAFKKRLIAKPLVCIPLFLICQSLSSCKLDDAETLSPKNGAKNAAESSSASQTDKPKPGAESPAASTTGGGGAGGINRGAASGAVSGSAVGASDPATVATDPGVVGTDPAEATPTAKLDATGGTGGLTGDLELKSASGLNFIMNAPADVHTSGKAYGVLVLLHGSTASNYRNFVKLMADVAKERDLIRVSVLAPNGQGWNEGGEVAAADALHALVQNEILAKYNVDKRKVLFSGQSSGGGFLSTNFVPQHAKDYQGGAFMQCGAASPRVAFTPDDATKAKFKLHFEITTGDPIWPASLKAALIKYTAAGMQFTKDDTKPGGHCAFDQQQVIRDHIDFILGTAAP